MNKHIIAIPTYNERGNIEILIKKIFDFHPDIHIMIIDDNSPDKTADVVEQMQNLHPNLYLLNRNEKDGLGEAYTAGFKKILEKQLFETITMMDGDLSHNPKYLKNMLNLSNEYDLVIGSRYIKDGGVTKKWSVLRRFLSAGANFYLRIMFRSSVRDWTTGYNTIKTSSLKKIDLEKLNPKGYAFISSLKYYLLKTGANAKETPIFFSERKQGKSKMSRSIIFEGICSPWKIIFSELF